MAEIYFIPLSDLTSVEKPLSSISLKERNLEPTRQNASDSVGEVLHPISMVDEYADKKENNTDLKVIESTYNLSSQSVQTNAKKRRNQVENSEDFAATSIRRPISLNDENQVKDSQSIDSERIWHEEKARERKTVFESIIQNESIEFSWYNTLFYPIIIVLASSASAIPFCVFPAHDLVKFPEFWYEILYHAAIVISYDWGFWTFLAGSMLNIRHFHRTQTILYVCMIGDVFMVFIFTSTYVFWTKILNYRYPIPFGGYSNVFVGYALVWVTIWWNIPRDLRKNEKMRKRMKYFSMVMVLAVNMVGIQLGLILVLKKLKGRFQPLLALAFPAARELFVWLGKKAAKNCADGDKTKTSLLWMYSMSTNHAIILCYVISSIANDATSWALMVTDFLLNIFLSIRIVWTQKRYTSSVPTLINQIQELAIYELVECHAPLSFMIVFAMAYYTPVGIVVGNVSNGYWAFDAVDDINSTLAKMALYFMVDFSSTILSGMILWIGCSISLRKVFVQLQREFLKPFTINLGYLVVVVKNMKY